MATETIDKKFTETTQLPEWARNDLDVTYWCKHDLSFRMEVFGANSRESQFRIQREAEKRNSR